MTSAIRATGWTSVGLGVLLFAATAASPVLAQDAPAQEPVRQDTATAKPTLEVYGFAQADLIFDFNQSDPNWYDVVRPTKLPSYTDQFGKDGHTYLSVRQSRFGVRGNLPNQGGHNVNATFEFDMFGVGPDAGQTTIRLRHAYGQWGQFGAGQTNSPFMDADVFPNSLDYWGPNGMLFFRNMQVFWRPLDDGRTRVTLALERPGASADAGVYADRIELQGVKPRFPAPDLSGEYRVSRNWGYVEVAGMLRRMNWDDVNGDQYQLSGHATGAGISLSSNVKVTPNDTLRLQYIYGHGIQNYFNDAPVDVGIKNNLSNPVTPVLGEALPVTGVVAFVDHNWNDQWSTAAGYSLVDIQNSDGQAPNAFKRGHYALINLLCAPVKNVMMGGEFQWARRENFSDGFGVNDFRLQFSFKYSFGLHVGG